MTEARLGLAIDSGQAARAAVDLDKLASAAAKTYAAVGKLGADASVAFKKAGSATNEFSQRIVHSVGQTSFMTKQLSFQLFDIAQGIPLAFDAPRYALQNLAIQTGQVAQLYAGQGGLKQAFADTAAIAGRFAERIKLLASSMLTFLVTPMGLVTAGAIAIGAAIAATVGLIVSRLPNAERALERHEDAIERIKKAWKEAEKGPEEYRRRAMAEIQFQTNQDMRTQRELLQRQIGGALGLGAVTGGGLAAQLREELVKIQYAIAWTAQQRAMQDYADAIKVFLDSVDAGNPDLEKFNATITDIANQHAGEKAYQQAAQALRNMGAAASDTLARIKQVNAAIPDLRIGSAFDLVGQGPTPADQAALDLAAARRRHQAAMQSIGARSPSELEAAARGFESALPMSETESPEGRQFRISAAGAEAYAQALQGLTDAERQRSDARQSSLVMARMEVDLVGKSIAEQERLRTETQLLDQAKQAARDAGTIVSQQEIDEIKAAAAELGKLVEMQARLAMQSDLMFERAQLFRSDTEQRVADAMRSLYGDDYLSHMNDAEAAMIRLNERMIEAHDLTRDFVGTFVDGLRDGKGALESLSAALDNLADRLLEMALDQAINQLFAGLFGAIGGAATGLPFNPVNIIGGGRSSPASSSASMAVSSRARGYSGSATMAQPRVELHMHNAPPVVSQTETPDGRGGRRMDVVFAEQVGAGAASRQGGQALGGAYGVQRRLIRR